MLALLGKVPVLRSVLGPLSKNPKLNMTERHRLENEALDRRYERERANLERRDKALDRVEARENRSLAREQRRLKEYRDAQRHRATRARRVGRYAQLSPIYTSEIVFHGIFLVGLFFMRYYCFSTILEK